MRKLGLVLVLLFTLSIVSAGAEFTLSGKITAKTGVTPLVDGAYPAAFTFSDGTSYSGQVTMTNEVFKADFSSMTDAASVIANSNTVTMAITALGQTQTFSNIPLTTVPKAAVASAAHLTNGAQQLEINLNSETYQGAADSTDEFWHIRSGGSSALSTIFSYQGTKQLQLDKALSTFYGRLNINANAAALRLIGNDHTYMEFYPDGASTRKAYLGFGSKDNDDLVIVNEITGKGVKLIADQISLRGPVGSGDSNPLVIDDTSGLVVENALTAGATTLGVTSATSYDTTGKTTTGSLESGTTTLGATSLYSLIMADVSGASRMLSPVGLTIFADKDNNDADGTASAFRVVANAASFNSQKNLLNLNQDGDLILYENKHGDGTDQTVSAPANGNADNNYGRREMTCPEGEYVVGIQQRWDHSGQNNYYTQKIFCRKL